MTAESTLGLLLILGSVVVLGLLISRLRLRSKVRRLLLAGMVLRILGGLSYLFLIGGYYGGGDYTLYFREGAELAHSAFTGEEGSIWDPTIWTEGRWWGTRLVSRVTGLLFILTGPTLPGAFIVFSLVSYVGIVAMGLAFHRVYPHVPVERYFIWIALFPSLWFWPTALGKDAIVLCGVGLAALGFVGKRNRPRWLLMALGVALVFCIRPQVAATLGFALAVGQWLGSGLRWTPMRMLQGVLFLVVGVGIVSMAGGALGIELFSPQEVEGYFDDKASGLNRGGSAMGVEKVDPWMAPINVLFRPFVWEARGVTTLLAAIEVLVLWGLAWRRRQDIKAFVRAHRRTRLFWLAVVFTLVYATALGMSLTNVGIIARQRVHILPFVFLFFAGAGGERKRRARAPLLQGRRPVAAQPVG